MSQNTKNSLEKEFAAIVGDENVMTGKTDLYAYSYDAAVLDPVMPGYVVRPCTSEALGATVRLCNQNGLTRILEINELDLYAIVEPGVVTSQLAAEVASRGLFYPPDPGSQTVSTIGGNVAENDGYLGVPRRQVRCCRHGSEK